MVTAAGSSLIDVSGEEVVGRDCIGKDACRPSKDGMTPIISTLKQTFLVVSIHVLRQA